MAVSKSHLAVILQTSSDFSLDKISGKPEILFCSKIFPNEPDKWLALGNELRQSQNPESGFANLVNPRRHTLDLVRGEMLNRLELVGDNNCR